MKQLSIVLFLFLLNCLAFGQDAEADFAKANNLFQEEKYEDARPIYADLLASDENNAFLHYNIGNCYYRQNKTGLAILHYEKALKLKPGDRDVKHNLAFAKAQQVESLDATSVHFLRSLYRKWLNTFHSKVWAVFCLLFFWGAFALFYMFLISPDSLKKRLSFFGGILMLTLTIGSFIFGQGRTQIERNNNQAIVLLNAYELKASPSEESKEVLKLHEGDKIILLEELNDWHKIRLINGKTGWVEAAAFEVI